jgi:hypothetical protein
MSLLGLMGTLLSSLAAIVIYTGKLVRESHSQHQITRHQTAWLAALVSEWKDSFMALWLGGIVIPHFYRHFFQMQLV